VNVTVVIPTYNRRGKLEACIESFTRQSATASIAEVIVIDDGSSDGTREYLEATLRADRPFPLRVRSAPHAGPAAARNVGIEAASGDLVLFTGDDCIASPELVERHLRAHRSVATRDRQQLSVLGFTTWLPELRITPFMHYQENGGSQFAYWRIVDPDDAGWGSYYTTNISTPRALLLRHRFDERFPEARFEDMDLGYRLERMGHRIHYCQDAVVWHDHPIAFETFRRASFRYGHYAALFCSFHSSAALEKAVGVEDARSTHTALGAALYTAERTIAELESAIPEIATQSPHFGTRGGQQILFECYRLLIHFELVRGIRHQLRLPPPRWIPAEIEPIHHSETLAPPP